MFCIRTLAAFVAASSLAAGQIALAGSVFDGQGGPLLADNVYFCTGNLTVPAGQTLTVQPGAVLKMNAGRVIVNGALQAAGDEEAPIVFTSLQDDTAGGDTNGDGDGTVGAPGQWGGLDFNGGSSGGFEHVELRFGGAGGFSNIYIASADTPLSFFEVLSRGCSQHGLDLNNQLTSATFESCRFEDNLGAAIWDANVNTLDQFTNNTASGNAGGDSTYVTSTSLTSSLTLGAANTLNGDIVLAGTPQVSPGAQLVVGAGVAFKMNSGRMIVRGDLQVQGAPGDPVVFTSIQDDSVGSDANADGAATTGLPGQWGGLDFDGGATGFVDHAEVRFGGAGGFSNFYLSNANTPVAISNTLSRDCSQHGADLNNMLTPATFDACRFEGNAGVALMDVNVNTLAQFTDNTAAGNAQGDTTRVTTSPLTTALTLDPTNTLNGDVVLAGNPVVSPGAQLVVHGGVAFKLSSGRLIVRGDLQALGTPSDPVVFTSIQDDSVGSDANADGAATMGAPGQWGGLDFDSATGVLDHVEVRFGGAGGFSNLYLSNANTAVAISNTLSRGCSQSGADLNNQVTPATFDQCRFEDNLGAAVNDVNFNTLAQFTDTTASGNGGGDSMFVTTSPLTTELALDTRHGIGATLVLAGNPTIAAAGRLLVEEGVAFKMTGGRIIVDGELHVAGSVKHPVVFTSTADDSVGGDALADGDAVLPVAGQWGGLDLDISATVSLENAVIRYSGAGGWAGVWCDADDAFLDQVRVEHGSNDGFRFTGDAFGDELVAFHCLTGFEFASGSAAVTRATSAGNSGAGMLGAAAFTGAVASALSGGNAGDWSGFANASVSYSAGVGVPAGTGNVAAAPSFVDVGAGNLRLVQGSVGIDAGDPVDFLTLTGQDQSGFGRLMDGDLDGNKRVDMGAYEFNNLTLSVTGDATPGGTLDIDLAMTAPFEQTFMFFGLAPFEYNVGRYGSLFVNLFEPSVIMIWPLPPKKVTLDIPLDAPVPTDIYLQAGGRLMRVGSAAGNLSNPVCVTVE